MLSQTSEYALRAMSWLAARSDDSPVRAQDLSHAADIPLGYLQKVLRRLVVAGLLKSTKGRGGGFRLARAPEEVRIYDVLAAVDAAPVGDRCAFGWDRCDPLRPCPLHGTFSALNEALLKWALSRTLADTLPLDDNMRERLAQHRSR